LRYITDEEPEQLERIVEADDCYIGSKFANMHVNKRKYWQDRNEDNKTAVMGLLERDGKARLTVIGAKTFKDVVRENVKPDALLITDTHLAYQGLSFEYAGHATVNHSQGEYRNGIAFTNSVEGLFSQFKRSILVFIIAFRQSTYTDIAPKLHIATIIER
jgi:hypothetical protein